MNRVVIIRHVPHESIGTLEQFLGSQRLPIEYVDCFADNWPEVERAGFDPARHAGLVVMGGPMNVDETDRYPHLATEVSWLRAAMSAGLPTLGICLGSQLMAKALGSRVYPHWVKEIGWHKIEVLHAARDNALFGGARPSETVFQWHGDTFDLPAGAVQLARSAACEQQAFRFGPSAYALQFHLEMTLDMVRDWFNVPEMCAEVAPLDYVNPGEIQRRASAALAEMAPLAERVLGGFARLCQARAAASQ